MIQHTESLGLIELKGWSAAMAVVDAAEKAAPIRLLQIELNDLDGVCIKLGGKPADVAGALKTGERIADTFGASCSVTAINRPCVRFEDVCLSGPQFNDLIEQQVVWTPAQEESMDKQVPFAIGMIETQGFIALIEASDAACKAAAVDIIGKEKLGGGYVTVVIKGDVAAVKAAVDAGRIRVNGLGRLVAAHVIAHPSAAVLSLLPK